MATSALEFVQQAGFGPDAAVHFHKVLAKVLSRQKRDCAAASHLTKVLEPANNQLRNLSSDIRLLTVSTIGSCHPERGVELWNEMIQQGYLSSSKASSCPSCWAFIIVAHERAGKNGTKIVQDVKLSQSTPFRHAQQVPQPIDAALLTGEPQPYQDPKESSVCQALEQHKARQYPRIPRLSSHGKISRDSYAA